MALRTVPCARPYSWVSVRSDGMRPVSSPLVILSRRMAASWRHGATGTSGSIVTPQTVTGQGKH